MKRFFLILIIISFNSDLRADFMDSLSIGIGAGYTNYNTMKGELYLTSDIELFNVNSEIKVGVNSHSYKLSFDNVSGLRASSIGLFGDAAFYPFNEGLFAGIRWETINFNWLSSGSKNKIMKERNYAPTDLYTGTSMFLQVGYKLKLFNNRLVTKIYVQPGFQQFKISNGFFSSGDFVASLEDNTIIENQHKFVCNINISVELRIRE